MTNPFRLVCRQVGCDSHWFQIRDVSIRQCKRCGEVSNAITPAHGLQYLRWIEALQSTSGKPSGDFDGCTD
jgi:hypothetical protein